MTDLEKKHCVPCEGGMPPLLQKDVEKLFLELRSPWKIVRASKLHQEFLFKNFKTALKFVNGIGKIAEEENHHPDITLSWGKVEVMLTTHAIGGLSQNDFILARKIEILYTLENKKD